MTKRTARPRAQVGFVCKCPHITPEEISAILGIDPSRSFTKGDLLPRPKHESAARCWPAEEYRRYASLWALEFDGLEVQPLAEQLLARLRPKEAALQQLTALPELELGISIWWDPQEGSTGFSILSAVLAQLVGLAQDLSVYLPGLGEYYKQAAIQSAPSVDARNLALGVDLHVLQWAWLAETVKYDLGIDQDQLTQIDSIGRYLDATTGQALALLLDYLPPVTPDALSEDTIARVSLVIRGQTAQPTELSKLLGIFPSRSFLKGESASQNDPSIVRPWGLWACECSGSDLDELAAELVELFADKHAILKELAANPEYDISIGMWWETPRGDGGFTLPTALLAQLSALSTTIHIYLLGGKFHFSEDEE